MFGLEEEMYAGGFRYGMESAFAFVAQLYKSGETAEGIVEKAKKFPAKQMNEYVSGWRAVRTNVSDSKSWHDSPECVIRKVWK